MPVSAYQRIVRAYSARKLALTRGGMRDLLRLLRDTSARITGDIEALSARYGQDNIRVDQLRGLRDRIEGAIDEFTSGYRAEVDVTRSRLGDSAVARASALTHEASGVMPASDVLVRAKLTAFEKLASRTRFSDGLLLSQRIWRTGETAKRDIGTILSRGVLQGYHPTKVARDLRSYVVGQGRGNLRYVTERLARTEFAAAYSETSRATIRAINRDRGIPVRFGMRFNISPGHPETDICDDYSTKGDLAPDIYSVGAYPTVPLHPHCECFDTPVPLNAKGEPLY